MYVYGFLEFHVYICVDVHMGSRRLNMGTRRLMCMHRPYMGPKCMYVGVQPVPWFLEK